MNCHTECYFDSESNLIRGDSCFGSVSNNEVWHDWVIAKFSTGWHLCQILCFWDTIGQDLTEYNLTFDEQTILGGTIYVFVYAIMEQVDDMECRYGCPFITFGHKESIELHDGTKVPKIYVIELGNISEVACVIDNIGTIDGEVMYIHSRTHWDLHNYPIPTQLMRINT